MSDDQVHTYMVILDPSDGDNDVRIEGRGFWVDEETNCLMIQGPRRPGTETVALFPFGSYHGIRKVASTAPDALGEYPIGPMLAGLVERPTVDTSALDDKPDTGEEVLLRRMRHMIDRLAEIATDLGERTTQRLVTEADNVLPKHMRPCLCGWSMNIPAVVMTNSNCPVHGG